MTTMEERVTSLCGGLSVEEVSKRLGVCEGCACDKENKQCAQRAIEVLKALENGTLGEVLEGGTPASVTYAKDTGTIGLANARDIRHG